MEMSQGQAQANQIWQLTVKQTWQDCGETLSEEDWGEGPYLTPEDVRDIEGCPGGLGCCECCHKNKCGNCFKFPRHPTLNQFFTPRMFAAYHREGYRVCVECDSFLED